jgi:WD40 repeat protein
MEHDTKDVSVVAFSPDQEYLVTVSNNERGQGSTVWVREAASGQIVDVQKCKANVKAVAFSPDGRYLVTAFTLRMVLLGMASSQRSAKARQLHKT